MRKPAIFGLLCAALMWNPGRGQEYVPVSGSKTRFPTVIEAPISDKIVKLRLTGAALRKRSLFSVYAIASYLQEGDAAKSAEALAESNSAKQLYLVLERDVQGREMVGAFQDAIRLNYAANAFAEEMKTFGDLFRSLAIKKGDHVRLTYIPNVGLHCQLVGKNEALIRNPHFSRAVWDIYLGKNNISSDIKAALISRL